MTHVCWWRVVPMLVDAVTLRGIIIAWLDVYRILSSHVCLQTCSYSIANPPCIGMSCDSTRGETIRLSNMTECRYLRLLGIFRISNPSNFKWNLLNWLCPDSQDLSNYYPAFSRHVIHSATAFTKFDFTLKYIFQKSNSISEVFLLDLCYALSILCR